LRRRQVVVKDHDVGVGRFDQTMQFLDLATPKVETPIRLLAALDKLAHDPRAGRFRQTL
jgi:hypothetical protein